MNNEKHASFNTCVQFFLIQKHILITQLRMRHYFMLTLFTNFQQRKNYSLDDLNNLCELRNSRTIVMLAREIFPIAVLVSLIFTTSLYAAEALEIGEEVCVEGFIMVGLNANIIISLLHKNIQLTFFSGWLVSLRDGRDTVGQTTVPHSR